jgi:predicted aldo/keto reductase-like oxidoreductase
MKEVRKQGKTRFIGISTHTQMGAQIAEANQIGAWDVILTAINFTMADDLDLLKAISDAAAKGTGIVAMKTLAGGSRWPNPESRQRYDNATIISAAMKWVMRNENIHTCIPGYTSFEHMRQDFAVAGNLEYTAQEESFLKDNSITLGMGFCRQCRGCLASCPKGVDVPTLMRTHMYAAQYADFHQARATLESIPKTAALSACSDCTACAAECVNSVDIPGRIEELKLIYA